MKNLEQIRAANAMNPARGLDRSAVNRLPAMILTNGLLATAVFCEAEGGGENRGVMKQALDATTEHLSKCGLIDSGRHNTAELIDELVSRDSHHLQRATVEALAFLAYLKRFTPNKIKD